MSYEIILIIYIFDINFVLTYEILIFNKLKEQKNKKQIRLELKKAKKNYINNNKLKVNKSTFYGI